jgi:hypothetical protein
MFLIPVKTKAFSYSPPHNNAKRSNMKMWVVIGSECYANGMLLLIRIKFAGNSTKSKN